MPVKGLKGVVSYDAMETIRNTNEWLGATARAMGSYPAFALVPNPAFHLLSAWGRVTERSFGRMVLKPDWEIPSIVGEEGQDQPDGADGPNPPLALVASLEGTVGQHHRQRAHQ